MSDSKAVCRGGGPVSGATAATAFLFSASTLFPSDWLSTILSCRNTSDKVPIHSTAKVQLMSKVSSKAWAELKLLADSITEVKSDATYVATDVTSRITAIPPSCKDPEEEDECNIRRPTGVICSVILLK